MAIERIVPGTDSFVWESGTHLARYDFALARLSPGRVLDAACGSGYGTELLARLAHQVVGIDVSAEALAHAVLLRRAGRVEFVKGDLGRIPLRDSSVDLVVSFESIEHVQ